MNEKKAGLILRSYRNNAGLTQGELAAMAGCSTTFVASLESSLKLPGTEELVRSLAFACGKDPGELIAAFARDRTARWLNNRPEHIPPETAAKLSAILDHEPVAA